MTPLLAFLATYTVTFVVVGYLTLRVCFWLTDRGES